MLFRDDYAVLAPAATVVALRRLFPYPLLDAEGLEELVVQVFRHGFAHDLAYDDSHQVGVHAVVVELGSRIEHEAAAKRLAAPVQVGLALAGALADVEGEAGCCGGESLRWDVLHHEAPRNSLVNPDKSCLPSAAQK